MRPDDKLYIYEITGTLETSSQQMGPLFLGCWNEGELSYLFFSKPARELVDKLLTDFPLCKYRSETVLDYDQWEPADALQPFTVGKLSFAPAWEPPKDAKDDVLLLDPGLVFGAGSHPTTRLCLQFMQDLFATEPPHLVIDLGTGTGILAVAAAKLAKCKVLAVDNNNLAVETALKNIAINGLNDLILCRGGDAQTFIDMKADLVMANLNLPALLKIFTPQVTYRGRWYIVSGLLGTEVHTFKESLLDLPLKITRHEMENSWSTLLLKTE